VLLVPEVKDQKPYVAIIKVSSLLNASSSTLFNYVLFFEDTYMLVWNIEVLCLLAYYEFSDHLGMLFVLHWRISNNYGVNVIHSLC